MHNSDDTRLNIEIRSIDGQQYIRLDDEEVTGAVIKAILQWHSSKNQDKRISVAINEQLVSEALISRTEFEDGIQRAIEQGAKRGEDRLRRGISRNPAYRKGMGL